MFRSMKILLAALAAPLMFVAPLHADDAPAPGKQEAQHFEKDIPVKLDYLLYLPADYQKDQEKTWPTIIFLHGSGERGSNVEKVAVHGPPQFLKEEKDLPLKQFIVVSPQCPANKRWMPFELNAFLDDIIAKYHVDKDRIYLTGLSMGGYGTWQWAEENSNRFAAIAPMSGGGNTSPNALRGLRNMPIWDFHGGADTTVPPEQSREMVEALKKIGNTEVKYTEYPGVGHDCWAEPYGTPELYDWFLQHKLSDRPAPARRGNGGRRRAANQ